MVLLKNEGILPIQPEGKKIAFIGKFAEQPRFQGGGSSHINSFKITGALEAAKEIAEVFVEAVKSRYEVKGKIKGTVQADLNFFMIYYVFPAILKRNHEYAKLLADTLCETWGSSFKNSKIGYTDYETLYKAFREKIFGIF